MSDVETVGGMLRAYRSAKDLGCNQLGRMIGYSGSVVSRWETGGLPPGREALAELAKALDLTDEQLGELVRLSGAKKGAA